jgi:uncharacterized membrane protein
VWNLILALIPYFFALIFVREKQKWRYIFFVLWLLFFPNSLYIWTDFLHLQTDGAMLHFDIVYIGVMALAGLFAGFASLELIHTYWNRHIHRAKAWIGVSGIMLISLVGVYIGRFLRFNSWDIIREPMHLIEEIVHLFLHPSSLPVASDIVRASGQMLYGENPLNFYGFILLYFAFYMLLYVFLYHSRKAE